MHIAYIWIVSHLSAKNYRNWWKFDEVLTKTNLLSFFGTRCSGVFGVGDFKYAIQNFKGAKGVAIATKFGQNEPKLNRTYCLYRIVRRRAWTSFVVFIKIVSALKTLCFYRAACNAERYSEENSVRPSVCLSVRHTRDP